MADVKDELQLKVDQTIALQREVESKLQELKSAQQAIDDTWEQVKEVMIANDVKSIKGDWGSITIAERINWEYDPSTLQPKFFKKVVDTKRLTDTFRLEGKEPKGATAKYVKYLTRRIK